MIDQVGFGKRVRSIREARSMTQEELAENAGLSPHYIGNLEQGVRRPSATALLKLCHALGATPNDLLQDSLSEDMLNGLSVNISQASTLRDALDVFEDALSDYLDFDDDEPDLFGVPLSDIRIPTSTPYAETLSSILLRMADSDNSL